MGDVTTKDLIGVWWLCECASPYCRVRHKLSQRVARRVESEDLAVVWRECLYGPEPGSVPVAHAKRYALYRPAAG